MAGTLQASESWHQVKLRHSTGTVRVPVYCLHKRKLHLLHLHFDLFKTIFAFLKVSLNILCQKSSFPI